MMVLSLDNLAHRYNCLPSEAMARATTFDLYVLDISAKYQRHQYQKQEQGQCGTSATITPKMSVDEMQSMIDKVRGAKK